ncbi:MAG: hypothetical protein JO312_17260 [Hyphomicrobiales bacterium]|nr:hypothetical protein [Hyphomicrobiales bacterium]
MKARHPGLIPDPLILVSVTAIDYVFRQTARGDGRAAQDRSVTTFWRDPACQRGAGRSDGLNDRGETALVRRADLLRVGLYDGEPAVRAVWREGRRVA